MNIKTISIADIKRAKYNPRKTLKPGDPAYDKLKKNLEKFGKVQPLVWNERNGVLVGGHQRLTIYEADGETDTEVVVVDLSDRDERILNLALNKHAGEWDHDGLAAMFDDLQLNVEDVEVAGFSLEEIAALRPPQFAPADAEAQGRLDQQTPITCPKCGHEFTK